MDVSANRFGLYEPRESIRLALGNFTGVRALMSWWIFMILIGSFPIVANFDDSTRKRRWKEKILTYDLISSRRSIWVSWGLYGSSVCGILSAQHFFDYHRRDGFHSERNTFELTPRLAMASFSSWTTSSPTTPEQLKPLVHRARIPLVSPSCVSGNENVKPRGSFSS